MFRQAGIRAARLRQALRRRMLSSQIEPRRSAGAVGGQKYVRFANRGSAPNSQRGYGLAAVLTIGGVGYYVVHLDYAPYTGRRRMIDISDEREKELGQQQFDEICRASRGKILPRNHPTTVRVETVVIDEPHEANAFCLPGGKVAVFTGLLPITPDDDGLASVMAHEIGHAVARHGAEKLGFVKILFIVQLLLSTVIDTFGITAYIVKLLGDLPNSRALEHEADFIGLRLMAKACYDPRAAPAMFSRLTDLANQKGQVVPKYLSTHPSGPDRISRLESWIPGVQPEYDSRCVKSHSDFFSAFSKEEGQLP